MVIKVFYFSKKVRNETKMFILLLLFYNIPEVLARTISASPPPKKKKKEEEKRHSEWKERSKTLFILRCHYYICIKFYGIYKIGVKINTFGSVIRTRSMYKTQLYSYVLTMNNYK